MKRSIKVKIRNLAFLLTIVFTVAIIVFIVMEASLRLTAHYMLQSIDDRSSTIANKPSDYLVVCFGDSATEGSGASNPDVYSYPAQLERFLQDHHPNVGIQVLNEGIAGSNSADTTERIRNQLKKYPRPPDLMIVMTSTNNMWNMHAATPLRTGTASLPKSKRWLARLETTRVGKLAIVAGFRGAELANRLMETKGTGKDNWLWRGENDNFIHIMNPWLPEERAFLKTWLLQDMKEIQKIAGSYEVPLLIGMYHNSRMNSLIRKVAEQVEIPVCDPAGKGILLGNFSGFLSEDGWHPNDKGYSIIANNYLECISASGLGPATQ